jgi:hypothetical protein
MSTFTDKQQEAHREHFISEYRQKALSGACHAEWVAKGLDKIAGEFTKLQEERRKLDEEIAKPETKNNRKPLYDRRDALDRVMKTLQLNMQQGQQSLNGLYQSIEASLQLAAHAETWE